jgi:hypothetical protein
MHRESVLRSGARNPIVAGDRLDTDIEGAARVGCDSLLVLTGVTTAAILLDAPPGQRPTYIAADLAGLMVPHPAAEPLGADRWACGGWTAVRAEAGGLLLTGAGPDDIDALRALCAAAWFGPAAAPTRPVHGDDAAAGSVLTRLGLDRGRPGGRP